MCLPLADLLWPDYGHHHGYRRREDHLMTDCLCCPCNFFSYLIYAIEEASYSLCSCFNWFGGRDRYCPPGYGSHHQQDYYVHPGFGPPPGAPAYWPSYGTLRPPSCSGASVCVPPPSLFIGGSCSGDFEHCHCCDCAHRREISCRPVDSCSANYAPRCGTRVNSCGQGSRDCW